MFIKGFDIDEYFDEVYQSIGICPQFDILWEDLTAEEHIYMFSRLKGIPEALNM